MSCSFPLRKFARAVIMMMSVLPLPVFPQASLLEVLNADSLVARSFSDASLRELIGNVRIRQENVYITCDRAIQNLTNNTVELVGNVVLTQDTLLLKTERGLYNGNTRTASTVAGVWLFDGHTTLSGRQGRYETKTRTAFFPTRVLVDEPRAVIAADQLVFHRDSSLAVASGNVAISFKDENALIRSDSAIHYLDKDISIFPRNPFLWQIDTTVTHRDPVTNEPDSIRLDTLSIEALYMQAVRDSTNRFLAEGDVAIVRGELASRAKRVEFFRNDSAIVFQHEPILWYKETQVTGDSIGVQLANNSVESVHVVANAFSLSQSKPSESDTLAPPGRFDQMKGKELLIEFRDDKLHRITTTTTAMSVYYLFDDRALNGVRVESGDRIIINFIDGEAQEIRTIGGIEGKYYPEKMITGRESEFNLEGFTLFTDRPTQPRHPGDIVPSNIGSVPLKEPGKTKK